MQNQLIGVCVIGVSAVALLAGCGKPTHPSSEDTTTFVSSTSAWPSALPSEQDAQQHPDNFEMSQTVAKDKMNDVLKDPDSARYKDVIGYTFTTDAGQTLYIFCGQVNAKNGLGGYMGYERFIATPKGGAVESGAGDFDSGWNQHCTGTPRPVTVF